MDEVGTPRFPIQRAMIIPNIIAGEHGDKHHIGFVLQGVVTEREQFLGSPVAAHPKIDDLDLPRPEGWTAR